MTVIVGVNVAVAVVVGVNVSVAIAVGVNVSVAVAVAVNVSVAVAVGVAAMQVPRRTETLAALRSDTARSCMPSLLKSPIATE